MNFASLSFLRRILVLDAATCLGMGVALSLAAPFFAEWTGLPAMLLRAAGIALMPIGLFMIFVARSEPLSRPGVWLIILGNVGWVLCSLGLLVFGGLSPTGLGIAFVLAQAAAVAVLAELEVIGLKREGGLAAA